MVKEQVRCLLEDVPRCRDDDRFLYKMFVYDNHREHIICEGGRYYIDIEARIPSTETVRRTRQKLQSEFKHLRPSNAANKRRIAHRERIEKEYSNSTLGDMAKMNYEFKQTVLL